MSVTPKALQKLIDERDASRASRKRAWENLQEIPWALKASAGMSAATGRKTIDLEGRPVKDGVRKAISDRKIVLSHPFQAIKEYRQLAGSGGSVIAMTFRAPPRDRFAPLQLSANGPNDEREIGSSHPS